TVGREFKSLTRHRRASPIGATSPCLSRYRMIGPGRLTRVVRTLGWSAPGRARSPREMGKISINAGSVGPRSRLKECGTLWRLQYLGDLAMPQGTVKWFNPTKGYGFIQPQEGGKDVFVHISAVERAGLSTLNEGQTVQYELVENRGKTSAENLKVK